MQRSVFNNKKKFVAFGLFVVFDLTLDSLSLTLHSRCPTTVNRKFIWGSGGEVRLRGPCPPTLNCTMWLCIVCSAAKCCCRQNEYRTKFCSVIKICSDTSWAMHLGKVCNVELPCFTMRCNGDRGDWRSGQHWSNVAGRWRGSRQT